MFNSLGEKLESIFSALKSKGSLTEKDIDSALSDIRVALLDADVALSVVKSFCEQIKQKSLGMKVLKSFLVSCIDVTDLKKKISLVKSGWMPIFLSCQEH